MDTNLQGPSIPIPRFARRQATGDNDTGPELPDSGAASIIIDIENETEPPQSASASLLLGRAIK